MIGYAFAALGLVTLVLGLAVWYYRSEAGALREEIEEGEAEEAVLREEQKARSTAEDARNTQLELRWAEKAEEAKRATDVDAAMARWGRVLRRLQLPEDKGDQGPGTP